MKIEMKKKLKMNQMVIRLPQDDEKIIREMAKHHETTISEVLRHLITTTETIESLKNNSTEDK